MSLKCVFRWILPSVIVLTLWAVIGEAEVLTDKPKAAWVRPAPTIEEASDGLLKSGDRLTKENMEVVREYLPEGMDVKLEQGADWILAETTPAERLLFPNQIQKTYENIGKAHVEDNGTLTYSGDGGAWIGGFPILEPKTGLDVMVNALFNTGDTYFSEGVLNWTNSKGEVYKRTKAVLRGKRPQGRVCQEPLEKMPGRDDEYKRELLHFVHPYDVKDVALLSVLYNDQEQLPSTWLYAPVLRRVQRLSTAQRYDSADGSDVRIGDVRIFNDPLDLWEFELIDRKPMLSLVTESQPRAGSDLWDYEEAERISGRYTRGQKLELRDTFIVEATPKDPTHIYTKKVMYLDALGYAPWWSAHYDTNGQLWMIVTVPADRRESPCGPYLAETTPSFTNVQTWTGTYVDLTAAAQVVDEKTINDNMFTVKYLAKLGR